MKCKGPGFESQRGGGGQFKIKTPMEIFNAKVFAGEQASSTVTLQPNPAKK
ncbi:hypothetical protein BH10BAC1_BH10BAC1_08460 [soil metagenome]